jgi:hypothetical protein
MNENEAKINKLTEKAGRHWMDYCSAIEDIRQLSKDVPSEEKVLKDITIDVRVAVYNDQEDFRGYESEKLIFGRRASNLDTKTIEEAIDYLKDLKKIYE